MTKMPILFAGHGSPMNAIEDNTFTASWKALADKISKPKAILAISAHWTTDGTYTQDEEHPKQIFDFYGFPKPLYEVKYEAPGSYELAQEILSLTNHKVSISNRWGIDHGTWTVLRFLYPNADIPITQLSIDMRLTPEEKFELGRKLSSLREKGVLIFGSGNVVHNLARVNWNMGDSGYPWASEFDHYISKHILTREFKSVIDYKGAGEAAKYAFTTSEHFDPLLYILGAVTETDQIEVFNQACTLGSLSMTGYLFK